MNKNYNIDGVLCGILPPDEGAEPIKNPVLAMAYVPIQSLNVVYTEDDALCQGTLFPDLDKPWLVKGFGGTKR